MVSRCDEKLININYFTGKIQDRLMLINQYNCQDTMLVSGFKDKTINNITVDSSFAEKNSPIWKIRYLQDFKNTINWALCVYKEVL